MDTRTGELVPMAEVKKMPVAERAHFIKCEMPPNAEQLARRPPKIQGYEKCPCGSGKQFKNCHKRQENILKWHRTGRGGRGTWAAR